jgi:hypothetical protein
MKLISMTDFVITQWSIDLTKKQRERISKYANFLKQPHKKGMFVPCDENDNLLNVCEIKSFRCGDCDCDFNYQQAKERVLFDGFETYKFSEEHIRFDYEDISLHWYNGSFDSFQGILPKTIEDLVKYNLTLTPNVIKELSL